MVRPLVDAWVATGPFDVSSCSPSARRRAPVAVAEGPLVAMLPDAGGRRLRVVGDRSAGRSGQAGAAPGRHQVHARPGHDRARRRTAAGRARLRCHRAGRAHRPDPARLLQRSGEDGARRSSRSTASAGCSPATWPPSTRTAPSRCSAGARCASTPAARRSTPRRSRPSSRPTPRCTTCWWSAWTTSDGASGSPRWCNRCGRAHHPRRAAVLPRRRWPATRCPAAGAGRPGRALAGRQGRLPLGQAHGRAV